MSRSITSATTDHSRAPAVAVAVLLVAFILVLWQETLRHLLGLWQIPTYFHGFVVPLVSAGLIADGWRSEDRFETWPLAAAGLGAASLAHIIAGRLDIMTVQHAALIAALISVIALVFGRSFAIRHRFALLFLFAAVPVGESLTPLLQQMTIVTTMTTLDLLGVEAVRVGEVIRTIPGDIHVVEACAGLQYLVAMAVIGILLAHLLYLDRWKQLTLMIFALLVPILANWIRVIVYVLVAVRTDTDFAAGSSHAVISWLMFGAVLAAFFGVAILFADRGAPARPTPPPARSNRLHPAWWAAGAGLIAVGGGLA